MSGLLTLGRIGERYHQLPSIVAAALDADPDQIDIEATLAAQLADCKRDFERDTALALKTWAGTHVLEVVVRLTEEAVFAQAEEAKRIMSGGRKA